MPARGLQFVLYAQGNLSDPCGPAFALNLNTGARMRHHVGLDPDAEPRFWFTLDVAIAREHGPARMVPPAVTVNVRARPIGMDTPVVDGTRYRAAAASHRPVI